MHLRPFCTLSWSLIAGSSTSHPALFRGDIVTVARRGHPRKRAARACVRTTKDNNILRKTNCQVSIYERRVRSSAAEHTPIRRPRVHDPFSERNEDDRCDAHGDRRGRKPRETRKNSTGRGIRRTKRDYRETAAVVEEGGDGDRSGVWVYAQDQRKIKCKL